MTKGPFGFAVLAVLTLTVGLITSAHAQSAKADAGPDACSPTYSQFKDADGALVNVLTVTCPRPTRAIAANDHRSAARKPVRVAADTPRPPA